MSSKQPPLGDVHAEHAFACAVPGRCGRKGQDVLHECRCCLAATGETALLSGAILGNAEFKSKKIRIPPADVGTSVLANRSLQSPFSSLSAEGSCLPSGQRGQELFGRQKATASDCQISQAVVSQMQAVLAQLMLEDEALAESVSLAYSRGLGRRFLQSLAPHLQVFGPLRHLQPSWWSCYPVMLELKHPVPATPYPLNVQMPGKKKVRNGMLKLEDTRKDRKHNWFHQVWFLVLCLLMREESAA